MRKKYELTDESIKGGIHTLYRIKALISFNDVTAGDLGGFIEKEDNLSHEGNAWVYKDAWVSGKAKVFDNAQILGHAEVYDNARISGNVLVSGNARVFGNVLVYDNVRVFDNARICDDVRVFGNALVYGNASVFGNAQVCGMANVLGDTHVFENAFVSDKAKVFGNAHVCGMANVFGRASITNNAIIKSTDDYVGIYGFGSENRHTTFYRDTNGDISVVCGCFNGTLDEFISRVKETHGNTKYAKEYLAIAGAAKIHFNKGE